jgi:hypothetical protein
MNQNMISSLAQRQASEVQTGNWQMSDNAAPKIKSPGETDEQGAEKDDKLQRIINKARMGKRLSAQELNYVAKKAPDTYIKIRNAMAERDAMRRSMEAVKTKEQVTGALVSHVATIQQTSPDEFVMAMRGNMLAEEHKTYTNTESYANKADMKSQAEDQKRSLKRKFTREEALRENTNERVENLEDLPENPEDLLKSLEAATAPQVQDPKSGEITDDSMDQIPQEESNANMELRIGADVMALSLPPRTSPAQVIRRPKEDITPKADIKPKAEITPPAENNQSKIKEYEEQNKHRKQNRPKIDTGV